MNDIKVFQIFYDEKTRQGLDPGFTPLDNTANLRPDWYEFWAIRNYLLENKLEEQSWYGFLSPQFFDKTGINSQKLAAFLNHHDLAADVTIVSFAWDQIAYFVNPFEQGEFWHPGLIDLSQRFFSKAGINLDCRNYVAHSQNCVFSNYVIAKPAYWKCWLQLADALFDEAESGNGELAEALNRSTRYGSPAGQAGQTAMKVFVQERIAPVLLAVNRFSVMAMGMSASAALFDRLFIESPRTRRLLHTCEAMKQEYCSSRDEEYLKMYKKVRALVPTRMNVPPA